jgi:hypothetical protein
VFIGGSFLFEPLLLYGPPAIKPKCVFCKTNPVGIVLPELQRFYGRAIVIITPVEMPIRDINRPLSIIIFVLYLSVYRVVLGRIYD